MQSVRPNRDQTKMHLSWYINLRWMTAVFLGVAGIVGWLTVLPATSATLFFGLGLAVAVNNVRLMRRLAKEPVGAGLIVTVVFDIVVLTLGLALAGGASNPFSFFYVVHVGIAAILLGERWTWLVAALASICFGALFFVHFDVPQLSHHHGSAEDSFSLHLQGMWLAFTMVAAVLAFFFTRLLRSIREKDHELLELTRKAVRAERFAVSATLAASAAHEMNTPLGTIRLLAEALQEELVDGADSQRLRLILCEIQRCQNIIRKLRSDTGGGVGELPGETLATEIISDATREISKLRLERLKFGASCEDITLYGPREGLVVSIRALLKNALEASNGEVLIEVARTLELQVVRVINPDVVLRPEHLARIGEPFFTTKDEGRSLGLGVYLARGMAESLGGSLKYISQAGLGTVAEFSFSTSYTVGRLAQNG